LVERKSVGVEGGHKRTHRDTGDFAHRNFEIPESAKHADMSETLNTTRPEDEFDAV
jgi:hypothetical protein